MDLKGTCWLFSAFTIVWYPAYPPFISIMSFVASKINYYYRHKEFTSMIFKIIKEIIIISYCYVNVSTYLYNVVKKKTSWVQKEEGLTTNHIIWCKKIIYYFIRIKRKVKIVINYINILYFILFFRKCIFEYY